VDVKADSSCTMVEVDWKLWMDGKGRGDAFSRSQRLQRRGEWKGEDHAKQVLGARMEMCHAESGLRSSKIDKGKVQGENEMQANTRRSLLLT
jgi:hypothetical protein